MTYSLGGALGTMQRISSVTTLLVLTLAVSASASEGQFDRRAQPSVFKHPVLDRWRSLEDVNKKRLEGVAQEIMKLSDAQVLALIPEQTPRIHHQCPVCARQKPVATLPEQPQPFPGIFDPLKPNQVQCKTCKIIFPNEAFPLTQSEVFQNLLGESVTIPYWDDKEGGRTLGEKLAGKTHHLYFRGIVDTARKQWLLPRMTALAQLYRLTREERYAQRLILVLDALSKRYPHYLLATDYGHRYTTTKGQKPPYGWIDTRWGRRSGDDLPADLLELFDLAASSPSLERTTKERIIANLFREPLKRIDLWIAETPDYFFGNECPLKEMAQRAFVLEDPERIHQCYRLIKDVPRHATACDGLFRESLGYGSLFRYTFFAGVHLLDGYSDPEGFIGSDGLHLQNLQPMKEMEHFYYRLSTGPDQLRLPSGGWLSYDDSDPGFGLTWWSAYGESCRPLERSGNVLVPGLRRAVLGAGSGDKQIQVALDFAEHGINHGQQSGLTLQIFAFGHNLIDDFPYHKSVLRRYAEMTVSHPTVVIDHQNQERELTAGDVELYAPLMDGVSAIRVNDARAYGGLASRYTRTLVLNSIDPDAPYVIDMFEVAGGTLHDYHLRSSSQHPSSASASLALQPLPGLRPLLPPGETWVEPRAQRQPVGSGYGLLFDVKQAAVTGPFSFASVCKEPWTRPPPQPKIGQREVPHPATGPFLATPESWPDRPAIGICHHVAVSKGYEFLTAESPSLTESGFTGIKDKPSDQWPRIPHRILRHQVKAGEASVFVVVHEPYHHAPKIRSVTRLDTDDDNVVVLRIESPGRMDTLVYALDHPRAVKAGGLVLSGRLGLLSQQAKQPPRAYLIEGTGLKAAGVDLACAVADYSGAVTSMERCWEGKGVNRFRVVPKTPLPTGDALRGSWMLVKLGPWTAAVTGERNEKIEKRFEGATQAVEIDHVATDAEGTWVYVNSDTGLSLRDTGVEEFYWPRRTFAGAAGFVIPTAVTTHPAPLPPRPQPLAIKPAASAPGTLKPGARAACFQGKGYDFKALKAVSESVVPTADAKTIGALEPPGALRLEGYLRVPADGLYTFHFGASDESRMTLEKVAVIESFRGCSVMPETRQVRLSAGLYALTLECFRATNRMPAWFTADWEGPGLPRQSFIPSLLTP